MKPRPFYRWKSFWLGLCVLVFLGWAWERSEYNPRGATWYPPLGHGVEASSALSLVKIVWGKASPPLRDTRGRTGISRVVVPLEIC